MLKIGQSDRFSYPVKVEIVGDGGARNNYTFDAIFRRLPREEFSELVRAAAAGEVDDLSLARRLVLGWKGIQDEDGNELAFSESNFDLVMGVWPVLPATAAAFMESHTPKAREKNSNR